MNTDLEQESKTRACRFRAFCLFSEIDWNNFETLKRDKHECNYVRRQDMNNRKDDL
jgi:hypothetical protein